MLDALPFWKLALYGAVVFLANTLQAITGFAGTALAMPPSMVLFGVDEARCALNIVCLASSALIVARTWRRIRWGVLVRIVALMFAGMVAGWALYGAVSSAVLLPAYGVVIVIVALRELAVTLKGPAGADAAGALPRPALLAVLVLSGVMQGLFVSGGALLVVCALRLLPDKDEFRATVAPVWLVLCGAMLAEQLATGAVTADDWLLTGVAAPVLLVAVWVGNRLMERLDQRAFMVLSCALLAVSGALLVL